ncbi:MAG: hypothetical protein AAGH64_02365 [Planctomycetota bacterium]
MTPNQRKSSPALYELVGNGRPPRTETTHVRAREVAPERAVDTPQPAPAAPSTPQLEGQIAPGGSVRVPAGVIFLIVAIVFAALFAGYLIGYQQKSNELVDEASREQVDGMQLPRDPLNTPAEPATPRVADTRRDRGTVAPTPGEGPVMVNPAPRAKAGPDEQAGGVSGQNARSIRMPGDPLTVIVENGVPDPRERGLNYLAITSEGRERVEPFLAYLNANGVDAAAYPVNNGVYRVYTLRGFTRDEYRTERRPFEDAMKRLTESFSDGEGRGVTFSAFWDKY